MTDRQTLAEAVAATIAAALPEAERSTKWNAPSFAVGGRDLITLNLPPRGTSVRVVFHRGAKAVDTKTGKRLIADPEGGLRWATDQRAHAELVDLADLEARAAWLARTCQAWVVAAT